MSELTNDEALVREALDNIGQEPMSRILDRLRTAEAERDMLEANTIGILAHERIVESLRAENERLRSALKGETELSG